MSDLPDPPVPQDADIRGFPFIPIDVTRLLTSETWIMSTGEEAKAAMTLWLQSWQQVPAGSVPDNDRVLAHLSMAGATWPHVKEMALRGWSKCNDGRLYHPVVCEKVLEALKGQRQRREAIAKRWAKKDGSSEEPEKAAEKQPEIPHVEPSEEQDVIQAEYVSEYEPDTARIRAEERAVIQEREKGKGKGTDREEDSCALASAAKKPGAIRGQVEFDDWYAQYPRKKDPKKALVAYLKAIKAGASHEDLMDGVLRYSAECIGKDPQYVKHPTSWLNAEAWKNAPDLITLTNGASNVRQLDFTRTYRQDPDSRLRALSKGIAGFDDALDELDGIRAGAY